MKKGTKKAGAKKPSSRTVKDLNPKSSVKGGSINPDDEGGLGGLM